MDVAENSEDTGTLQALKALDSLESKINQVQVAYQQFYTTIGIESAWKAFLDGTKSVINTLNSLPKLFGKIPINAIAAISSVISVIKTALFGGLSLIIKEWQAYTAQNNEKLSQENQNGGTKSAQSWINSFLNIWRSRKGEITSEMQSTMAEGTAKTMPGSTGTTLPGTAQSNSTKAFNNIANGAKNAAKYINIAGQAISAFSLLINTTSQNGKKLSGALMSIGGAVSLISGVISKNPIAIITGLLNVISGFSTAYESIEERVERLNQEATELSNKAKEIKANYNILDRSVKKLNELQQKRYESSESAEEYQNAINDLAESFPELVIQFTDTGDAIINVKEAEELLAQKRLETVNATYSAAKKEKELAEARTKKSEADFYEAASKIIDQLSDSAAGIVADSTAAEEVRNAAQKVSQETPIGKKRVDFLFDGIKNNRTVAAYDNVAYFLSDIYTKRHDSYFNEYDNIKILDRYQDLFTYEDEEYIFDENNLNELITRIKQDITEATGEEYNTLLGLLEVIDSDFSSYEDPLEQAVSKYQSLLTEYNGAITTQDDPGKIFNLAEQLLRNIETINRITNGEIGETLTQKKEELDQIIQEYQEYKSNLNAEESSDRGLYTQWQQQKAERDKEAFSYVGSGLEAIVSDYLYNLNKNKGGFNEANDYDYVKTTELFDALYDAVKIKGDEALQGLIERLNNLDFYSGTDIVEYIKDLKIELNEETEKILSSGFRKENSDKLKVELKNLLDTYKNIPKDLQAEIENRTEESAEQLTEFERRFYASILPVVFSYEDLGLTTPDFVGLLEKIKNLSPSLKKAILANGFATQEAIEKTINSLEDAGETDLAKDFKIIKDKIISNLNLSITATLEKFVSSWSDASKEFKKLTSGLDVSEALQILQKASTLDGVNITAKDFQTVNGKLILTQQKADEYWKAYIKDTEKQIETWKKEIEKAEQNLENKNTLEELKQEADAIANLVGIEVWSTLWDKEAQDFKVSYDKVRTAISEALKQLGINIANANAALGWASDEIEQETNWNKGDFSSLGLNKAQIKALATGSMLLGQNDAAKRAARDKINSGFKSLISDVLSKGIENINLSDYSGILDYEKGTIRQYIANRNYKGLIEKYAKYATDSIEEINSFITQAIEKETLISAQDALKNVNFYSKDYATASLDTIKKLADALGVNVNTILGEYIAGLDEYSINLSKVPLDKITNSTEMLSDSIASVIDSIVKYYTKGLEGKLTQSDIAAFNAQLSIYDGVDQLTASDFQQTAEGMKLSEEAAIRLNAQLSKTIGIQNSLTFKALVDNLKKNNEYYKDAYSSLARIKELNDQINNSKVSSKRRDMYKQELELAKQIAAINLSTGEGFDFMNNKLSPGLQGGVDFINSVGKMFKSWNTAVQDNKGRIDLTDFVNIAQALNSMVETGQEMEFAGHKLDGSMTSVAALLTDAFGAIDNVDAEGATINLNKLGSAFNISAEGMGKDIDKALHSFAESQIKILDAEIQFLEAIVAMEKLGDIDVDQNGIFNLKDIFKFDDNDEIIGYTDEWYNKIQELIGGLTKVQKAAIEAVKIYDKDGNVHTLAEILNASYKDLQNLDITAEQYGALMMSIVSWANSNDYDLANLYTSMQEMLSSSGFTGEVEVKGVKFKVGPPTVEIDTDNGMKTDSPEPFGINGEEAAQTVAVTAELAEDTPDELKELIQNKDGISRKVILNPELGDKHPELNELIENKQIERTALLNLGIGNDDSGLFGSNLIPEKQVKIMPVLDENNSLVTEVSAFSNAVAELQAVIQNLQQVISGIPTDINVVATLSPDKVHLVEKKVPVYIPFGTAVPTYVPLGTYVNAYVPFGTKIPAYVPNDVSVPVNIPTDASIPVKIADDISVPVNTDGVTVSLNPESTQELNKNLQELSNLITKLLPDSNENSEKTETEENKKAYSDLQLIIYNLNEILSQLLEWAKITLSSIQTLNDIIKGLQDINSRVDKENNVAVLDTKIVHLAPAELKAIKDLDTIIKESYNQIASSISELCSALIEQFKQVLDEYQPKEQEEIATKETPEWDRAFLRKRTNIYGISSYDMYLVSKDKSTVAKHQVSEEELAKKLQIDVSYPWLTSKLLNQDPFGPVYSEILHDESKGYSIREISDTEFFDSTGLERPKSFNDIIEQINTLLKTTVEDLFGTITTAISTLIDNIFGIPSDDNNEVNLRKQLEDSSIKVEELYNQLLECYNTFSEKIQNFIGSLNELDTVLGTLQSTINELKNLTFTATLSPKIVHLAPEDKKIQLDENARVKLDENQTVHLADDKIAVHLADGETVSLADGIEISSIENLNTTLKDDIVPLLKKITGKSAGTEEPVIEETDDQNLPTQTSSTEEKSGGIGQLFVKRTMQFGRIPEYELFFVPEDKSKEVQRKKITEKELQEQFNIQPGWGSTSAFKNKNMLSPSVYAQIMSSQPGQNNLREISDKEFLYYTQGFTGYINGFDWVYSKVSERIEQTVKDTENLLGVNKKGGGSGGGHGFDIQNNDNQNNSEKEKSIFDKIYDYFYYNETINKIDKWLNDQLDGLLFAEGSAEENPFSDMEKRVQASYVQAVQEGSAKISVPLNYEELKNSFNDIIKYFDTETDDITFSQLEEFAKILDNYQYLPEDLEAVVSNFITSVYEHPEELNASQVWEDFKKDQAEFFENNSEPLEIPARLVTDVKSEDLNYIQSLLDNKNLQLSFDFSGSNKTLLVEIRQAQTDVAEDTKQLNKELKNSGSLFDDLHNQIKSYKTEYEELLNDAQLSLNTYENAPTSGNLETVKEYIGDINTLISQLNQARSSAFSVGDQDALDKIDKLLTEATKLKTQIEETANLNIKSKNADDALKKTGLIANNTEKQIRNVNQTVTVKTSEAEQNLKNLTTAAKGADEAIQSAYKSLHSGGLTKGPDNRIIESSKANYANAKGNVALAKGRRTLLGELGPELYVTGGHYYVAGQNGAEFIDLPDDAIVFNHLQTKRLMSTGTSSRGKAVGGEKRAVAHAKGNAEGPAMASASAALSALKNIRALWDSILNASLQDLGSKAGLGKSSGGGGGGKNGAVLDAGYIRDLERWYNLLRQIDRLEQDINYQEQLRSKLEADSVSNGREIYESYRRSYEMLQNEVDRRVELAELKKGYYEQRMQEIEEGPWGDIFYFNGEGVPQMKNLDLLANVFASTEEGGAVHSAREQYALLQQAGFGDLMQFKEDGSRVEWYDEEGKEREEAYKEAVEAFSAKLDSQTEEINTLREDYIEEMGNILELQTKQNEILTQIRENTIAVEEEVLKALEESRKAEIDELQKQRDALSNSTDKFIEGLTDSLNKEREMYNTQQNNQELVSMRRQLAILQRSGGSADQIRSLQQQIAQREQDSYFDQQQKQIDAVKEASDLQLERLDTQISLMTETLEYQKSNGLLWEGVHEIMQLTEAEIQDFITTNNPEWWSKSMTQRQNDLVELGNKIEQWVAHRDDISVLGETIKTAINEGIRAITEVEARTSESQPYTAYGDGGTTAPTSNNSGGSSKGSGGKSGSSNNNASTNTITTSDWQQDSTWHWRIKTASNGEQHIFDKGLHNKRKKIDTGATWTCYCDVCNHYMGIEYKTNTNNSQTTTTKTNNNNNNVQQDMELKVHGYSFTFNGRKYSYSGPKYSSAIAARQGAINRISNLKDMEDRKGVTAKQIAIWEQEAKRTLTVFKRGGLVDFTGPAWVDGTKKKPEGILNAEQLKMLRNSVLTRRNPIAALLADYGDTIGNTANATTYNTIDHGAVSIDHVDVNLNIAKVSDDYDSRRIGQNVMDEMVKIARKTKVNSLSRG